MIAEDPTDADDESNENADGTDNSENTAESEADENAESGPEDSDSEEAEGEEPDEDTVQEVTSEDSEGEAEETPHEVEPDDDTPKVYDFSHPQHRLNKPLSGLSVSANKVANVLASRVDLSMHVPCSATVVATELQKHKDIANDLHASGCVFEVDTKQSGKCYLILQPQLVFALVQSFFGGNEDYEFEASDRVLSTTETRLATRLRDCIIASLATVWGDSPGFSVSRKEPLAHDQFAASELESPIVATLQFELKFGSRAATFSVLFPYQSLDELHLKNTSSIESMPENNSQWHSGLRRQLVGCELDIHGVLAETEITVNQLLKMQKGDFIPLGSVQTATFSTGNTPLFEAVIGASNGRVSASISHWLGHKDSTDGAAANEHFRK